MELTLEDGKILNAAADGSASPYGPYMCAKGMASVDFHNGAENRLLASLKRNQANEFVPIKSSVALDEIAQRLQSLIERYGPRSVALYHGTGAYRSVLGAQLEKSFLSAIDCPNLFSTMTIDQSAKWVTMARMGFMASGKPALADLDVALIAGNNPVVSHQTMPFAAGESGAPGRAYARAKKRGTKIIIIDPRRTETARYADLLIQPLPGHDASIFAAIAHILLRDKTYNRNFCDRFVTQLEELQRAVAPFTPDMAARRADVPVEQIEQAAEWLGSAERAFVGSGTGPSMSAHSNLNDHMIEVVNALLGGYRRAGDPVRNPGVLNPRRPVETAVPPNRSWERGDKLRSVDIGKLFGEFPTALLPREIQATGEDRIRALIVFGGDPMMGLGDPDAVIPAFEQLDLMVVLDPRMNETAKYAHYVVAASQPFERHDISTPGDALYPEAFAQYAPPVLDKPGDVIHDWEFFWGLAARMGVQLTLKYWNYGQDFESIEEGMALDTHTAPDPEAMIRFLCKNSRIPFDVLKANPSGVRLEGEFQQVLPAARDNAARLHLCPGDVAEELAVVLRDDPRDTGFAYQLTCRRILEAMNGAYRDAARTRARYPVNWTYMNPEDMARQGLAGGDSIEIRSSAGAIRGVVREDQGLRPGVISMTHLFGQLLPCSDPREQGGSFTGRLVSLTESLQPINYMPRYSGVPVDVIKLPVQ